MTTALLTVAEAGKCPFGYGSSEQTDADIDEVTDSLITVKSRADLAKWPSDILQCPSDKTEVLTTKEFSSDDYESLVKEIIVVMDALPETKDKTAFAGCLVRLEGHDLMDFRRLNKKKTEEVEQDLEVPRYLVVLMDVSTSQKVITQDFHSALPRLELKKSMVTGVISSVLPTSSSSLPKLSRADWLLTMMQMICLRIILYPQSSNFSFKLEEPP